MKPPCPFQFTTDMVPVYASTILASEQMCRETVVRLVKGMRRIQFNVRRCYKYEELPSVLRDEQGSHHSGYSFACCFNHAMLIHRFGWKSYVAQSRAVRRQRLRSTL